MALKLVTAEEMRHIDETTIRDRGIGGLELMERAGQAIAATVLERFSPRQVGIVTGKGNNAGDGLVVARLVSEAGVSVKVVMLTDGQNLSEGGRVNFERLPENVEIIHREQVPRLTEVFAGCEVVIDAILGTGVRGPVTGTMGEAIGVINSLDIPIVAIDIPSGLQTDDGLTEGACVQANLTITVGLPKRGLILGKGKEMAGEIVVADIGFPDDLSESDEIRLHLLTEDDVISALPFRPLDGHKGTFGSLLVLAGSAGMSGAAYLTIATALRSGCGMVFAALPAEIERIVAARIVEAVKVPIEGSGGSHLTHQCWEELERFFGKVNAIALGPGIGTHPDTARLVDELVCVESPMVIDADGLNCLEEKALYLTERKAPTILTPHPGEMARLLGISVEEVQADRIETARRLAREAEVVVVLKGAGTVVASADGRAWINPTGNDGMAKGGSGDVLTGLIGGLLAQGCPALEAACAGVYIHGVAGDLAAVEIGTRGMVAGDIVARIPEALMEFDR
ncbi:NAD(P)H-hydrate dehydratase [bacterium]|nr:NAD(P)H-hydrate dehydratase [bacterium]